MTIGGRGWSFSGSTSSSKLAVLLEQSVLGGFLLLGDQLDVLLDGDERGDVEVDDRVRAVELAGLLEEPVGQFADLHADGFGQTADGDREGDLDRPLDLRDLLLAAAGLRRRAWRGPRREPNCSSIVSTWPPGPMTTEPRSTRGPP